MARLLRWLFTPPNKSWVPYMRHLDEGDYSYNFKGVEFGVRFGRKRLPVCRVALESGYQMPDSNAFSERLIAGENEAREKAAYLNAMAGALST